MENECSIVLLDPENHRSRGLVDSHGMANAQPPQLARLTPEPLDDPDHDDGDETTYREIYRQIP
jgi:hypothetical protein